MFAVDFVPPIADEESLVEKSSDGTQTSVLPAAALTHVKHLTLGLDVGVEAGVGHVSTIEVGSRDFR